MSRSAYGRRDGAKELPADEQRAGGGVLTSGRLWLHQRVPTPKLKNLIGRPRNSCCDAGLLFLTPASGHKHHATGKRASGSRPTHVDLRRCCTFNGGAGDTRGGGWFGHTGDGSGENDNCDSCDFFHVLHVLCGIVTLNQSDKPGIFWGGLPVVPLTARQDPDGQHRVSDSVCDERVP